MRIIRALCPPPPPDEREPLAPWFGELDAISDGLQWLHFEHYVRHARDVLMGKAQRRDEHPLLAAVKLGVY